MSALGVDPAGNVYFTGAYLGSQTDYVFRVTEDGGFNAIYGSTTAPLHPLFNQLSRSASTVMSGSPAETLAVINSNGPFAIGIQEGDDARDGGSAQFASSTTPRNRLRTQWRSRPFDNNRVRQLTRVARAKAPAIPAAQIVNAFSYAGGPISPANSCPSSAPASAPKRCKWPRP